MHSNMKIFIKHSENILHTTAYSQIELNNTVHFSAIWMNVFRSNMSKYFLKFIWLKKQWIAFVKAELQKEGDGGIINHPLTKDAQKLLIKEKKHKCDLFSDLSVHTFFL